MDLADLAALVAENPDLVDPYLVYADQLQETGDPRGELITLDRMRLESPHDPERVRAVARHLDRHRHALLGPLVDLSACLTDVKWHLGFLKSVTLLHPQNARPDEVAAWVEALLEAPAGRFLRELTLTPLMAGDYTTVMRSLALRGRSLRSLRIGPGLGQSPVRMEVSGAANALRSLESLSLAATWIRLGRLDLPRLRQLELWVDTFSSDHLHAIVNAEWDSLRALSLAFSHGRTELPRLLLARMPHLEHLRVGARVPAELAGFVGELARSELARGLVTLAIAGVGRDDIERLVDSAGAFESLKQLRIRSRGQIDDLFDRFRERGVEVTYRRSQEFDPWDEPTDVEPNDTLDLGLEISVGG